MFGATPHERAYVAPFFLFMALLAAGQLVAKLFEGQAFWMVATPQYWVFPLQTLACSAVLAHYWPFYEWQRPERLGFTISIAVLVFVIWVAPQEILGFSPRRSGFDPAFFGRDGPLFPLHVGFRFLRLVLVVPLLEEIFWRGFLLRYLIHHDFTKVPFGTFRWGAFGIVAIVFALAHWGPDFWPPGPDFWPALITGALYNLVALRTGQLSSCVVAHAITNLLLGLYIMRTGQWGFW
jgi:CAAX prenyl protease-like protein